MREKPELKIYAFFSQVSEETGIPIEDVDKIYSDFVERSMEVIPLSSNYNVPGLGRFYATTSHMRRHTMKLGNKIFYNLLKVQDDYFPLSPKTLTSLNKLAYWYLKNIHLADKLKEKQSFTDYKDIPLMVLPLFKIKHYIVPREFDPSLYPHLHNLVHFAKDLYEYFNEKYLLIFDLNPPLFKTNFDPKDKTSGTRQDIINYLNFRRDYFSKVLNQHQYENLNQ